MLNLSVYNGVERRISWDKVVDRPEFRTIWENKLQTLNHGERITFLSVFCFITSVAIIGNLLTIYVVLTRKQRLMFKICLLSLAISDLTYAASCGANYISKLIFNTSALWYLGRHGCTIIPFLQTSSVLSGSISIVSIALDRYMAIFNRKSQWEPGIIFCLAGVIIIWLTAAGISSPMFFSYETVNIIVVPEENQENFYIAQLCTISNDDKEGTLYYYSIIFIFVFLPLFITFVTFNAIIACEIYKRRKAPGDFHERKSNKKHNEDSSSTAECDAKTSNDTNSTSVRNNASKDASIESSQPHQQIFIVQTQQQNNDRCNERQRRQMRMFRVILILVCVFILFRIPTWIFLLVKLNYYIEPRAQWIMNYTFSAIGILNSTVNPFLYTFLSQTIRCTSYIREICHKFCKLCKSKATTAQQENYVNNATMFAKNDDLNKRHCDNGGVYLGN